MAKAAAYAKVTVIALLNLGVVGCSSVLAVHGNGTPGGMYWVLGLGAVWVVGFAIRAFTLVGRGDESGGVSLVSATLLYAFALALVASLALGVISQFSGGR